MQKEYTFFTIFVFLAFNIVAQTVNSPNNYITYQKGNLPFIISVPHGGNIEPSTILDRVCNNPTTVTDSYTIELARAIDTAFMQQTGCRPHIIICNLKRTKLDCNRNLADGACGNADAALAWNYFHNYIDSAQAAAKSQFSGKAFYIDLHGHGHAIQQLELGYLLTATELANTDAVLNTSTYVNSSSIRNLVSNNTNNYTHAELLRGNFALGTLLYNAGFPSVPSLLTPSPGGNPYFDGGYNTANHTSNAVGNTVNGVQIETYYTGVRDAYANRKRFGDSIARVLVRYMNIQQSVSTANCNLVLPAFLNSFSVNGNGCQANIAFSLGQAQNLQGIHIENSSNGIQFTTVKNIHFIQIGTLLQQYTYTHTLQKNGIEYFRLKLIDNDGTYQYSNSITYKANCTVRNTYQIYPNPTSNILQIKDGFSGERKIVITNMYGQIIEKISASSNTINVQLLPSGYYNLCINNYVQIPFIKY